jgi:hypothetical protein
MNKITLLFLAFVTSFSMYAQETDPLEKVSVYECLKQDRTTFIKQTEVSISDWFSYIFDLHIEDWESDEEFDVSSMFPDSIADINKPIYEIFKRTWPGDFDAKAKWQTSIVSFPLYLTKEEKKKKDYENLLSMPLTGLAYSDVNKFLKWKGIKLDEFGDPEGDREYYHQVSLVSVAMYDTLIQNAIEARRSVKDKEGNLTVVGDSANTSGCFLYNFKGSANCAASAGRLKMYGTLKGPVGVTSYMPDVNGFYNLLGNVAEMTEVEGVAKGGHYEIYASEILKNKEQKYETGDVLIGFRYWVKLIEK